MDKKRKAEDDSPAEPTNPDDAAAHFTFPQGYLKKLRKKQADGRINTDSLLLDCKAHGIAVAASVRYAGYK
jgi:hypothetical protein